MNEFILDDGRRLCYREDGAGEPLVLLHGWSMSSAVFQEVMRMLAADYRVLAPDLAGHGVSEPARPGFGLDDLAADIEAWLAALGFGKINLLGWSLGGQVALRMVVRKRVAVTKLVLVAATPLFISGGDWEHGLPPTQVRAMDRQMQRHYEQSMGEFFRLMFEDEKVGSERYREILRFAVRDGSLPTREVARQGLKILGRTDLRPLLAGIDLPVLVHYGRLDLITEPAACRFLAEQIPGAVEASWEGVGHAPFLSRPDDSVRLWREFLQ